MGMSEIKRFLCNIIGHDWFPEEHIYNEYDIEKTHYECIFCGVKKLCDYDNWPEDTYCSIRFKLDITKHRIRSKYLSVKSITTQWLCNKIFGHKMEYWCSFVEDVHISSSIMPRKVIKSKTMICHRCGFKNEKKINWEKEIYAIGIMEPYIKKEIEKFSLSGDIDKILDLKFLNRYHFDVKELQ